MIVKDEVIPADQHLFCEIIKSSPDASVFIKGSSEGYEVLISPVSGTDFSYILQTQRKNIRRFKSPSTLFRFLEDIGVRKFLVEDSHLCSSDYYVKKNSKRHQKRVELLTKKGN